MSIRNVEGSNRGEEEKIKSECCRYGGNGCLDKSSNACDHKHKQQVSETRRRCVHLKYAVCRKRERR